MGERVKVLCTICARGGSEGVKNKNLMTLRGKPLIAHTIMQAKKSGLFETISVSSDSDKILRAAKKWGADFVIDRPKEMASSTAPKLPVIQHAVLETERVQNKQYDMVVDLDVTSPLRTIDDVCNAFRLLAEHEHAGNLVTAYPARRSPYFNMLEMTENGFVKLAKYPDKPIYRRQDAPSCYDMNASIYVWRRNSLFEYENVINDRTLVYVMPEERSIDIDSRVDLELVRILAKQREDFR
ncbi:MAG: posttranslational modification protein [uncultured bacterium]|nr:MAG: posttranslational modification protein [uncultured bacterium]